MTWLDPILDHRTLLLERILPAAVLVLCLLVALDLVTGLGDQPALESSLLVQAQAISPAPPMDDATAAQAVLDRGLLSGIGGNPRDRSHQDEPVLLGTIAGQGGLALVRAGEGQPVQVIRPGDRLPGLGRLVEVDRHRVVFEGEDGRRELLAPELGGEPSLRVQRLGESRWALGRTDLERGLERLDHLAADLRVRPVTEAGRPAGLEVAWLRPGSLGDRLGLIQGDRLRSVNGIPLDSMNDLIRIVGLLQVDRQFTLELQRGGLARELLYEIVD